MNTNENTQDLNPENQSNDESSENIEKNTDSNPENQEYEEASGNEIKNPGTDSRVWEYEFEKGRYIIPMERPKVIDDEELLELRIKKPKATIMRNMGRDMKFGELMDAGAKLADVDKRVMNKIDPSDVMRVIDFLNKFLDVDDIETTAEDSGPDDRVFEYEFTNGKYTVPLKYPFKLGKLKYDHLRLRLPQGNILRGLGANMKMGDLMNAVEKIADIDRRTMNELDCCDCTHLLDFLGKFL